MVFVKKNSAIWNLEETLLLFFSAFNLIPGKKENRRDKNIYIFFNSVSTSDYKCVGFLQAKSPIMLLTPSIYNDDLGVFKTYYFSIII